MANFRIHWDNDASTDWIGAEALADLLYSKDVPVRYIESEDHAPHIDRVLDLMKREGYTATNLHGETLSHGQWAYCIDGRPVPTWKLRSALQDLYVSSPEDYEDDKGYVERRLAVSH